MSLDADRAILIEAIEKAERLLPRPTLLGGPSDEYKRILTEAIDACSAYKEVEGQTLYSADSLVILHAPRLAMDLYYRIHTSAADGANWLLRLLGTRTADGFFKAAMWGISLSEPLILSENTRLIPFDQMSESYIKGRIDERAKRYAAHTPWLAPNYWAAPTVAYVREVRDVPYIGRGKEAADLVDHLYREARDRWTLIEMVGAGGPLVFASWFEYADRTLDLAAIENTMSWTLPEVAPRILSVTDVRTQVLEYYFAKYVALPSDFKDVLVRCAHRFCLSQCRKELIDRVLDLAPALEVAVTGRSEPHLPANWKVSVRTAQMIGGNLETRIQNRKRISDFYNLRNAATHGGRLEGYAIGRVEEAAEVFRQLFVSLLRFGRRPDWSAIEMESVSQQ
jgi:hypothetical protein